VTLSLPDFGATFSALCFYPNFKFRNQLQTLSKSDMLLKGEELPLVTRPSAGQRQAAGLLESEYQHETR